MEKENLREQMLAKRAALTDAQIQEASEQVYERIIALPQVRDSKTVLVYADFDQEIRTGELTGWLLYNGKQVALPVIEDDEMDAVNYRGNLLRTTRFGIASPVGGPADVIDPTKIDLIVCPGVAFTRGLDRIGFGRGYYDKFFAHAPQAYRIGLAYDFQIVDQADMESHDVKMNVVVTPDETLS